MLNPDLRTGQPGASQGRDGLQGGEVQGFVESSRITPMFDVISPTMLKLEERGDLSEADIVKKHKQFEFGYRPFNRLRAIVRVNGPDGSFTREVVQDTPAPGIVWFDGVVETLEDIEGDPKRADTVSWMRERGVSKIISVQRFVRKYTDTGEELGIFKTFAFGPHDRVLKRGHSIRIRKLRSKR